MKYSVTRYLKRDLCITKIVLHYEKGLFLCASKSTSFNRLHADILFPSRDVNSTFNTFDTQIETLNLASWISQVYFLSIMPHKTHEHIENTLATRALI